MAGKRFKEHQQIGKQYSPEENLRLAQQAKSILENELQGYRDVALLPDGRLTVSSKTNFLDESVNQQVISLLLGARSERQALQGINSAPNVKTSPVDAENIAILNEAIRRGVMHPDVFKVAGRGFRHPSQVSTDDLMRKFINDIQQIGRGYDSETGAAFTQQHKQSGHKLDDNLYPHLGHSIDNIAQQSRIVNQVTADSAKNRSAVNPKYKSIVDQRNKALDLTKEQFRQGYKAPVYTDDGDSDIYGRALDDLINQVRFAGGSLNISPQMMEGMRANNINKMQTQGVVLGNVVNK